MTSPPNGAPHLRHSGRRDRRRVRHRRGDRHRLLAGARRWSCWTATPRVQIPAAVAVGAADVSDDDFEPRRHRPGGETQVSTLLSTTPASVLETVADNADDEWHRVFDVNVLGAVWVTRAALQHLRAPRPRRSSTRARSQRPSACRNEPRASATKGALAALTRAMAADHLAEGIRVNCQPRHGRHPVGQPPPRHGSQSRGGTCRARRSPAPRPLVTPDEVAAARLTLSTQQRRRPPVHRWR